MTTTIKLQNPAQKGEREITELTFTEPKVKHLLAGDRYKDGSHHQDVAIVSALTGEPETLIGEIYPEDWAKIRRHINETMRGFFVVDEPEDPTTAAEAKAAADD